MAQARYFNRGTLRGIVSKSDLIEYTGKNGKDKFLAVEVNTGGTNKVKATFFNNKSNPNKAQELHEQYPVNSKVEVTGAIGEREFEGNNGKKGIDRSLSGFSLRAKREEAKDGAFFIFQGMVQRIVETEDGAKVTVLYVEEYENAQKEKVTREETVTLHADHDVVELISDVDLTTGCNAKFKGQILNKLEFDEYGDVIDNIQMFKIDKIEDVVQKDELTEGEKLDFL